MSSCGFAPLSDGGYQLIRKFRTLNHQFDCSMITCLRYTHEYILLVDQLKKVPWESRSVEVQDAFEESNSRINALANQVAMSTINKFHDPLSESLHCALLRQRKLLSSDAEAEARLNLEISELEGGHEQPALLAARKLTVMTLVGALAAMATYLI